MAMEPHLENAAYRWAAKDNDRTRMARLYDLATDESLTPPGHIPFMDFWCQAHHSQTPDRTVVAFTYDVVARYLYGMKTEPGEVVPPVFSDGAVAAIADVGHAPGGDVAVERNTEGLRTGVRNLGLDPDECLTVWFGKHEQDAGLDIPEEFGPLGPGEAVSSWAPIEVGTCSPSTMLMHLLQCGAVGRWPYGSRTLEIVHMINPAKYMDRRAV